MSDNADTPAPVVDAEAVALEAARAVVPADAAGYAINIPDSLKTFVAAEPGDPAWQTLAKHAAEQKWPQGRVDDAVNLLEAFARDNLLEPVFDPAAETAKLGANGKAQQQEQEAYLTALKARGDIAEEDFGELMSLVPTAAGTRALAKLRGLMGPAGAAIPPPAIDPVEGGQPGDTPAQAEARKQARDPNYGVDVKFTKAADAAWMAAFGG